jgi:Zn-dependent protease
MRFGEDGWNEKGPMELHCFLIVTILWVFSVCLHEFGHAIMAYQGGDHTVREKGYLTMNPIRYTHPVYSLALPLFFVIIGGIGLPGGAVYINTSLLRSRQWETAVALAGPGMNVILILLVTIGFQTGLIPSDSTKLATVAMAFFLQLQISALLLNLVPLPPLDGFQAIAPWLPPAWRERLLGSANLGMFILLLALWFTPLGPHFWDLVNEICRSLGVFPNWGRMGYRAFRFWDN